MILGFFTVSGHSMLPAFSPNDKVLVSALPYLLRKPQEGDVILFNKNGKTFIKRIKSIKGERIYVEGDNVHDSLEVESFNRGEIIGKVIFKIT